MKYAPILLASAITTLAIASTPDPLAPKPNGLQSATPSKHLIINATIHAAPGQTIEHADILIDQGIIIAIGPDLDPGNATIWDIQGAHIYAGFIDSYIEVDAPMPPTNAQGNHWSNKVTPQRDALDIGLPADAAKSLRQLGFTTAMIAPDDGIFRGWSAVVSTAADFKDDSLGDPPTYQARTGQMMGFDRGGWGDPGYPTSHMGVIALMRQTFIDAQHRATTNHTDTSCLDEIDPKNTTLFYETNHELEALLADNIATEFDHANLVIIDNGTAHRRLEAFAQMGYPMIVPLRFPKTPDVFTVGGADSVDLATLQHWERAPANAHWLFNSRINVALTTSKANDHDDFWDNLHTAIKKGLDPSTALAMITTNPANILRLENQGSLKTNNIANIVIADGNLFDPNSDAKIINLFIDGRPHHINNQTNTRFDGSWTIDLVGIPFQLTMDIEDDTITIAADNNGEHFTTNARKVVIDSNQISFIIDDPNSDINVLTGTLSPDGLIRGSILNPAQQPFQWTATKSAAITFAQFAGTWNIMLDNKHEFDMEIARDTVTVIKLTENGDDISQRASKTLINYSELVIETDYEAFGMPGRLTFVLFPSDENEFIGSGTRPKEEGFRSFGVTATKKIPAEDKSNLLPDFPTTPFGPYAYDESQLAQVQYILTNATIWTQSGKGIIEHGSVWVRDGKILKINSSEHGFDIDQSGGPAIIQIDATGMHITPGLIDAHSHTGLFRFGVNESGQAVTSEVRIADSLDPAHPGFYRELAGGLTTAMLLHGSANPIGGQSQTIKLRWNSAKPSDMFFQGAKPGIKFALGENVKQSNWGDKNTTRYPQTRMGVETLIRDRFTKAREYADRGMKTIEGGQDLELETLAQILAGERLVHCHSYRQDEILMLCRIAEEFDFKIGTFQHGLETYKVAEIVKEYAIGTSIFSDWWAYKVEVTDAIPFAGPINHQVGLLTSYNSDSDDVARRMHVEAGKALKYAKLSGIDMTEQEALAFVTTNPAIQLGIIDRVGTLEVGKDADLVLWTGHPLSSLSRPEMTFVDGRLYFSRQLDAQLQKQNADERQRLIQKILAKGQPANEDNDDDSDDSEHDHDHDPNQFNNTDRGNCGCNQLLPAYHTNY